jgi:hypothetical protein
MGGYFETRGKLRKTWFFVGGYAKEILRMYAGGNFLRNVSARFEDTYSYNFPTMQ